MEMLQAIQTMLRLQELEIIACELKIMKDLTTPQSLQCIEGKISKLLETLPLEYRNRYLQLRKNGMAIAKEYGGICQNCRMTLAIPLLTRMRQGETPWLCPNCGHFLQLSMQNN